jgi:hypothetical protein
VNHYYKRVFSFSSHTQAYIVMGGGTSRLEDTDWEKADGCITAEQTIAGDAPTLKYQLYEIQKLSVGQRAFDVVDAEQNVVLTTQGVAGTLSWFDVLGPKSIGDYKDLKLRVQADMSRRTWIVYRYHTPVFVGQKAANENVGGDCEHLFKGVEPGVKLYKTACITVSWSRYVAVAARYGPPSAEDFLNLEMEDDNNGDVFCDSVGVDTPTSNSEVVASPKDKSFNQLSSNISDEDPLFSIAKQIAARSRERANTGSSDGDPDDVETEEIDPRETNKNSGANEVISGAEKDEKKDGNKEHATNNDQEETAGDCKEQNGMVEVSTLQVKTADATKDDGNTRMFPASSSDDRFSPASSTQIPVSSSANASPPKEYTGPKRPATTLTELAASHSSSTRRTSVRAQKFRDYFSNSATSSTSASAQSSSRFGSRLFRKNASSNVSEEGWDADLPANATPASTPKNKNDDMPTSKQLYELALEGVIDLDTQPIVQCQEISCKLLGNHQTFNMTKEQLFQLLRLDEKQHEEQLQQECEGENGESFAQNVDNLTNPMVQATELDTVHQKEQAGARSARWMSSIQNFRARNSKTSPSNADDITTIDTVESEDKGEDIKEAASPSSHNDPSPTHGRLRSSFNRFFASKSAEEAATNAPDDMILSVEKSLAECTPDHKADEGSNGETKAAPAFANDLDRDTMPSLLDDSNSSSQQVLDAIVDDDSEQARENGQIAAAEVPSSPAPGSGVEESKVEAAETPQKNETAEIPQKNETNGINSTEEIGGVVESPAVEGVPPVDDHPHPLVGYWFWKHTTFNFGQHKMFMHLAKNSDLALHLILSIIVNHRTSPCFVFH